MAGKVNYTWTCFRWAQSDGEEVAIPGTYTMRVDRFSVSLTNRNGVAVLPDYARYYGDEVYGDLIKQVREAQFDVDVSQFDLANLRKGADDKAKYRALADVGGAWAELQICLGALIVALKEHKADDRTIELIGNWLTAVRAANDKSIEAVKEHNRITSYEDAIPAGEGWVGCWPLGTGAYGKTHLYKRQNKHGQICNNLVVKDCDYGLDPGQRYMWDNMGWLWATDRNEPTIPVEVQTMSDLRGRNGAEFVVKILNWRIARERRLYRLYLEVRYNINPFSNRKLTTSQ